MSPFLILSCIRAVRFKVFLAETQEMPANAKSLIIAVFNDLSVVCRGHRWPYMRDGSLWYGVKYSTRIEHVPNICEFEHSAGVQG